MLPRPTTRCPGQPKHTGGFDAAGHERLPGRQELPVLRRDHDVVLRVPPPVTTLVDVELHRRQIQTGLAGHFTHPFSPRYQVCHSAFCTACSRATVKAITGMAIANITINRVTTTALHR